MGRIYKRVIRKPGKNRNNEAKRSKWTSNYQRGNGKDTRTYEKWQSRVTR